MKRKLPFTFLFVLLSCLATHNNFGQNTGNLDVLLSKLNTYSSTGLSKSQALRKHFTEMQQNTILQYASSKRQQPPVSIETKDGDNFYALDIYLNYGDFGTVPIAGPYDINTIATQEYEIHADDFDGTGTLYLSDADWNWLYSMDHTTGVLTELGEFTGLLPGHWVNGLSYNFTNSTMYALSIDGLGSTQLYSLNTATRVLTPIGGGTGNPVGIWLEIDNNGIAYMADIETDSLYTVNLTTGVAAMVGPLGIDIEWAQDATIDPANNTLYMSGNLLEESFVYSVNLSTGQTTMLGNSNFAEYGGFSLPGNPTLAVTETNMDQISIYPNPVIDNLNLDIPSSIAIEEIKLFDSLGKEIFIKYKDGKIDLSSLATGIYQLIIRTQKGDIAKKIVKGY